MPKKSLTFRQRDVTAAVKGVRKGGQHVGRVEIGKDGKIIVIVGSGEAEAPAPDDENEWDGVKW